MEHQHPSKTHSRLKTRIGHFFYAEEVPYGLALVRIFLPLVLLVVVIQRWPHTRELFSLDGAATPLANNFGYPGLLPELPGTVAIALMSALGFFLVTSSIGWCTRISLIASTVLYTYFSMMDSLSTITKYSVIATHILLLLSLSNCGSIWSVDSWLSGIWRRNPSPGGVTIVWPKSSAWPRRLMQILFGVIYFGAAITKMHTPAFLTGEQMIFWLMTNVNYDNPIGEYLTLYPALLVVFAYVVIIWEILFLFLAWKGLGRPVMLALGVFFHIMTAATLGLYIFPLVCVSAYFAFFEEEDARNAAKFIRRIRRKFGWQGTRLVWLRKQQATLSNIRTSHSTSSTLFTCSLAVVAFSGMGIEHKIDPYGLRRPGGLYELEEVSREYMAKAMRPMERIRPVDKLLHFAIGTQLLGGHLSNEKYNFRQGDKLIGQCVFNPPHEDMWVECNLHDAQDRVLDRIGQIVAREKLKANFYYHLNDALIPGEYFLVIKSAGVEIGRRTVKLFPAVQSSVAN